MAGAHSYLKLLLSNLKTIRDQANLSDSDLEERLILGPGWIHRFESGDTIPSIDMLLAILNESGAGLNDLLAGLPDPEPAAIERSIFAEEAGKDIRVHFRYANFDAQYTLRDSTIDDFETVIKTLRNGLALLVNSSSEAIKTDAVSRAFLEAVRLWPHANPSDLWWFIIYRAYCDPYNHPAKYARLDFTQSWKRTGGWALEEILVRHYGPFLKANGVNMSIEDSAAKVRIVSALKIADKVEPDKIDVVLTGDTATGPRFFGVVHVKASFAERRTDDVPLSQALIKAGYTSPLWTMDCKSGPGVRPVNRGELGALGNKRSAKRKDVEDEGYFTGVFSYNKHTHPSPTTLPDENRVYVCNFSDPDDVFSQFILTRWQAFQAQGD
jgi:transcriptional regulator with XRE-family HTH domain